MSEILSARTEARLPQLFTGLKPGVTTQLANWRICSWFTDRWSRARF